VSDFQAIGGVSATLQTLLFDRMERPDGVANVSVTVGTPRRPDDPAVVEDPRVNLFLYRVTENGYLQNQEIPGQGTGGAFGRPPLSLNLHYLLTAYGSVAVQDAPVAAPFFDERIAHFLLGSAMRVLHDVPVVTPQLLTVTAPSGMPVLHDSLRDAFERVKITLEPLSLEDITKVWTALSLRYRLSAAYLVTVVQIESRRSRTFPRPVGQPPSPVPPLPGSPPVPGPMVHVITIRTPSITEVRVRPQGLTTVRPFPYAAIGDTLIVRGYNLAGGDVRVRLGELRIPVVNPASNEQLEVDVPDATIVNVGTIPPAQRLQPGARPLSVTVADPLVPQSAMISNDAVVMIVPRITPPLAYVAAPPRALDIAGTRLVNVDATGETVIGRAVVPRASYLAATPTQLRVGIPDALPMRGVSFLLGNPLPASVPLGPTPQSLRIDIGAHVTTVSTGLPNPVSRDALPGILQALIRDAQPSDPRYAGARVVLVDDPPDRRLLVIPGGLVAPIGITSPAPSTLAGDLGLTAVPPASVGHALLSGPLGAVPFVTADNPRLTVQIGPGAPQAITFARPTSIDDAATRLETVIVAIGGTAGYLNARVTPVGDRLLVIPGDAGDVTFGAAPGDDRSVSELQLRARYAVRVRVNGAESIDDVFVELPA
jgi:hypothetical protein